MWTFLSIPVCWAQCSVSESVSAWCALMSRKRAQEHGRRLQRGCVCSACLCGCLVPVCACLVSPVPSGLSPGGPGGDLGVQRGVASFYKKIYFILDLDQIILVLNKWS